MNGEIKMLDKELNLFVINTDGEKKYIPNFGHVNAGFPSPAEDFVDDRISLDERYLTHPESTFLIVVGGDSMYPVYQKNDILVVIGFKSSISQLKSDLINLDFRI